MNHRGRLQGEMITPLIVLFFSDAAMSQFILHAVLPHQYARIIIGAVCIGAGFSLSTLIYEEDRLPFFARTLIQLLLCAVMLLIAFAISGGIPDGTGFGTGAVFVLAEIGIGFVFWIGNLAYFYREARQIKIKLKEQDER